jgi:seryl-tRNA synthetase
MRARPPIHFLLLLLSAVICVWFGTNNFKLSTLLQQAEESAVQQADNARNHILQLDKMVTQLHGNAEHIKKEYTSVSPQIEQLLKKQQQEHNHVSTQLKDAEQKLSEAKSKNGELEKQLRGLVSSMNVGHKEQINKIGKQFKNGTVHLSVVVAYNWEDATKQVRPLSLLYIIDYFNVIASKVLYFFS